MRDAIGAFEIQAHRGNDADTLSRLLDARPSSVEIDVAVTADGELICSHETTASELECPPSPLLGRPWHELTADDALALGRLSFGRAIELAAGTRVVAEAKSVAGESAAPERFVEALAPYLATIGLVSFDERVLTLSRQRQPGLATTFLFEEQLRITTTASAIGPRADLVTPNLVRAAHEVGLRVVPWTVNDPLEMAGLIDLGVDGLVTDEPALARSVCGRRAGIAIS